MQRRLCMEDRGRRSIRSALDNVDGMRSMRVDLLVIEEQMALIGCKVQDLWAVLRLMTIH